MAAPRRGVAFKPPATGMNLEGGGEELAPQNAIGPPHCVHFTLDLKLGLDRQWSGAGPPVDRYIYNIIQSH